MTWIPKLIINAAVVFFAAYILPGVGVDGYLTAVIVAIILVVLNALIKPLLIIVTIPITILTLGLFLFAINAIIILFADYLIDGFRVDSFWWALIFSFVMSLLNSILGNSDKSKYKKERK
ncbi:MAG: phage holin family protein [Flavobacteriales bacterium]|nr:phage holin family protein [Flavobacteriales bacterium]